MTMTIAPYLILYAVAVALCFALFFALGKGLSSRSIHQQYARFFIGSLLAVLPVAVNQVPLTQPSVVVAMAVSGLWMVTYPVLYNISNRRTVTEINLCYDYACGLYFFSMLTTVIVLTEQTTGMAAMGLIPALFELPLLMLVIGQWGYAVMYKECINPDGMILVQDTNTNEIIEFTRAYRWYGTLLMAIGLLLPAAALIWLNVAWAPQMPATSWWQTAVALLAASVAFYTTFLDKHAAWGRCGLIQLYTDTADYRRGQLEYGRKAADRQARITVTANNPADTDPQTIMLVIGESSSRDYMTAFSGMQPENTPWLSRMARDSEHTILFKNAYSCHIRTVESLEKALTEYNQYNDKTFIDSCSIVDLARKAGYTIHWYSNQGHLGVNDTPVTLVAETADVAKWTVQKVGQPQYDHRLLDFFPEIDPAKRNLLVLHLKGSHFNFANRYPDDFAPKAGKDNIEHYRTSQAYTDSVLERFFDTARKDLGLRAMIYFSDHATLADKKRAPRFSGYGEARIPLFVWLSDKYQELHPAVTAALRANRDRCWTNDLAYELVAGVMDVTSPQVDMTACLASPLYRFTTDDLVTWGGRKRIADDPTPICQIAK